MKKRKPPIILASFLILLVGAGIIFNASFQKPPTPPRPDGDQMEKAKALESRKPDSTKTISSRISNVFKATAKNPQGGPAAEGGDSGPSPSIHVAKPVTTAPKNNDPNRTSGQWYTKESGAGN